MSVNCAEVLFGIIFWYDVAATPADDKNAVYFDLHGRRVAQPGKGLYIMNGKKVVIK